MSSFTFPFCYSSYSTSTPSTAQEMEEILPAVVLHFDYINREKKKRCYILLDDDPQAFQVHYTHTHMNCHPSALFINHHYYYSRS